MSSNVLYKFRSQKDPSRITFDGTGISVFEVKREIIKRDIRTDGRDLDLLLFNKDTKDEYTDDTTIIPRSTLLEAVRRPAARPGQGRCARYLTGPIPTLAKSSYQKAASQSNTTKAGTNGISGEDDEETAALKARASYWEQEKQKMASATPVFYNKKPGSKPTDSKPHPERRGPPSHPYVCHRCSKPGHWIEECPTNGDEKFNNRPRFKRATGIPRSNLEVIDDDEELSDDGMNDGKRQTVMINELGQRVRARPDEVAWEQHKAKVDASKEKQELASQNSAELDERGILCPVDRKAFVNPVKTPCCARTYCHECIENALLDSGLVCPGCESENIVVEDLVPDAETAAKVKAYEDEKKPKEEISRPHSSSDASTKSNENSHKNNIKSETTPQPTSASPCPSTASKKRPAEDELPNDRQGQPPNAAAVDMQKSKLQSPEPDTKPSPGQSTPLNAPTGPAADRNKINNFDNPMMQNMGFPMMPMGGGMDLNQMMLMGGMNPYADFAGNFGMGNGMPNNMPNGMMNGMNGMNNRNNINGMTGTTNYQNQHQNQNQNRHHQYSNNNNFTKGPGGMRGGGAHNNNFRGNHAQNFRGNFNNNMNNNMNTHQHQHQHQQQQQQRGGFKPRFGGCVGNNSQNGNGDGAYERNPVNGRGRAGVVRELRPAEYKEL